jgi:hypothetical protein
LIESNDHRPSKTSGPFGFDLAAQKAKSPQVIERDFGKAAELWQKAANQSDQRAIAKLKELSGHRK